MDNDTTVVFPPTHPQPPSNPRSTSATRTSHGDTSTPVHIASDEAGIVTAEDSQVVAEAPPISSLMQMDSGEDSAEDDSSDYEMPEEQAPEEQGAAAPPMAADLGDDDVGGGLYADDEMGAHPVEQSVVSAGIQMGENGGIVTRGGGGSSSAMGGVGQSSHKIGMVYSPGSIPLGLRKQRSQHASHLTSPTQSTTVASPEAISHEDDFLKNLENELNQKPTPPKQEPKGKSGRSVGGGASSASTSPQGPSISASTPQDAKFSLYEFESHSAQPHIFPSGSNAGAKPAASSVGHRTTPPRSQSASSSSSSVSAPVSSSDSESSAGESSEEGDKHKSKKKAPKKVSGGARLALARLRAKQKSAGEAKKNKTNRP